MGYLELERARLFSRQNPASGMQLLQQEDQLSTNHNKITKRYK